MRSIPADFPELFFYDNYSYYDGSETGKWVIFPTYYYDKATAFPKQRTLELQTGLILNRIRSLPNLTPYRKCLAIHDFLTRNIEYDMAAYESEDKNEHFPSYTLENVLISGKKKATCSGIAKAFKYLCNQMGIPCMFVVGWSSKPNERTGNENWRANSTSWDHAWNIVQTEYGTGHIDVTWDICLTKKEQPLRYDYFFLPDQMMSQDHIFKNCPRCSPTGKSYYEINGLYFQSLQEIDRYVSIWMKRGKRYFCFKVGDRCPHEEVKNIVYKRGCELLTYKWMMYTYPNYEQRVFLFTFPEQQS